MINRERMKIKKNSSELSKYIYKHDAGKMTEIKTKIRKLTVFFSDIRNFTSTSEKATRGFNKVLK